MTPDRSTASFPAPLVIVGFVFAAAVIASVAPLATYAVSLATFGLVHVVSEVRYVDERFRLRLGQGLVLGVVSLLAVIVGWRSWLVLGGSPGPAPASLELGLVSMLAVTALVAVRSAGWVAALVATAVVVSLAVGAYAAPLTALVLLAILHNMTPVGFLAERLRGAQRRRVLAASTIVFVAVPMVVGSGLLREAWQGLDLPLPSGSFWRVGDVEQHLGVFVPPGLTDTAMAVDLFAAVVYLQVMHYAAVIHLLPRLNQRVADDPHDAPSVWPTRTVFAVLLGVIAAASLLAFALWFREARRVYGVFAAFHAWLEVPILLLALGGGRVLKRRVVT